jgi:hypothetical protein
VSALGLQTGQGPTESDVLSRRERLGVGAPGGFEAAVGSLVVGDLLKSVTDIEDVSGLARVGKSFELERQPFLGCFGGAGADGKGLADEPRIAEVPSDHECLLAKLCRQTGLALQVSHTSELDEGFGHEHRVTESSRLPPAVLSQAGTDEPMVSSQGLCIGTISQAPEQRRRALDVGEEESQRLRGPSL